MPPVRAGISPLLILFATTSWAETVIWLPVPEPPGFYYQHPMGGITWAPDGGRFAYAWYEYQAPQYHSFDLWFVRLDGAHTRCVHLDWQSFGDGLSGHAAWSPHGNWIAVANGPRISLVDPACASVIDTLVIGKHPSWSPDGEDLAYEHTGIWRVRVANGDAEQILPEGRQPTWSPDGLHVAFVRASGTGDEGNLFVASVDGTDVRQLTSSGYDAWPAWSPDGRSIAFSHRDLDAGAYFTWSIWIDAAGGTPRRVVENGAGESRLRPCWSSDGQQLAYYLFRQDAPYAGIAITDLAALPTVPVSWGHVKGAYR